MTRSWSAAGRRRVAKSGAALAILLIAIASGRAESARGETPTLVGPLTDAPSLRAARHAARGPQLRLYYELRRGAAAGTPLTAWLGADYVDVVEEGRETLYDFRLRRRIVIDRRAGTFANFSLYGDAAFRQFDLQNRLDLARRLAEAGQEELKPLALERFWLESQLGLLTQENEHQPLLTEAKPSGAVGLRLKDEEVALFAPSSEVRLPPELRRALGHFLRYRLPLHPDVIAAITADGRLPGRVVFVTIADGKREPAAILLQRGETVEDDYPLPPGFRPAFPLRNEDDHDGKTMREAFPMMAAAIAGTAAGGPPSLGRYRRAIDQALARGAGFEAALLIVEMTLTFGREASDCAIGARDAPCHGAAEINRVLARDPRAAALFKAQAADRENAAEALAQWQAIPRDDTPHGYVLAIYLAHHLSLSGQRSAAAAEFLRAFRGDPYLPLLYKYLGDHFLRGLRTDLGWLCYDLGRSLPSRSNADVLSDIDRIEAQLLKLYPDFF